VRDKDRLDLTTYRGIKMTTALPIDRPWYRELLAIAIAMGLVVGLLGLVYLGITGGLTDRIFGDPRIDTWSGDWWWIPFVAAGGLLAAGVRDRLKITDHVPGGVAVIESGRVDHAAAPSWILLAAVSAIAGASLGPSFALVVIGGGLGSWISSRRWPGDETARLDTTMAGISGGFGGAFTSPGLGALIVTELAPTPRDRYLESILPQLIAATFAFAVFFGVVGTTFLNSFAVPVDDFSSWHLLVGAALGVASSAIMIVFVIVVKLMEMIAAKLANPYVRGAVGGALVGLIAFALPLTIGAGNDQLTTVIDESASISIWLLLAVLVGKMLAMAISLAAGFIGGNVLPMLFVGGTAGVMAHLMFPDIPEAIAVGCMLAAVPGATIKAPIGLTFVAVLAVGLGPLTAAPVIIAVAMAYLTTASVVELIRSRRVDVPDPHA
jgi:H+/Cl- antiporter ClcA